jgi:hypothetical protein
MGPWLEYLAALEANVDRGSELLESGALDTADSAGALEEVVMPAGGRCPERLRGRAVEALRRIGELELALTTRQQELARQLQQRPAMPPTPQRLGWGLSIRM